MMLPRLLVGCGIVVLALWAAGLVVEQSVSAVAPNGPNLVSVAAMPVPTLSPLRPLQLPKRDMFAADMQPAQSPNGGLGANAKGIGSFTVPDVAGAPAASSPLTVLATGVDLDANAGYALIQDADGGRIVHVGDVVGNGGLRIVGIRPRVIELSDGSIVTIAAASSRGGGGGVEQIGPSSAGAREGGYFGPGGGQVAPPAPQGTPGVPGIPLNGSVNSITVNPGLNVGTNPGGFSSATGIPSGTAPAGLSGALGGVLPGGATTGLGTSNAYQGIDAFGSPNANASPGVVNPGAVR